MLHNLFHLIHFFRKMAVSENRTHTFTSTSPTRLCTVNLHEKHDSSFHNELAAPRTCASRCKSRLANHLISREIASDQPQNDDEDINTKCTRNYNTEDAKKQQQSIQNYRIFPQKYGSCFLTAYLREICVWT